jgi:hypothetical protein
MKQKLLCGLMALVLGPAALGQTPASYENFGLVQCPPEIPPTIDASNFVNHAQFFINFTAENNPFFPVSTPPFETTSTLNYTNDFGAVMSCNTGFRMETYPLPSGPRKRASTLYNNGTIDCGTVGTSNVNILVSILFNLDSGVKCLVNASNIYNPGTINIGMDSLLSLTGENIDVTDGTLAMENSLFNGVNGFNGFFFFNTSFFDGYWGLGLPSTNDYVNRAIDPVALYESTPAMTQFHEVTNRNYTVTDQQLGGPTFVSYLLDVTDASGSNRTVRAVFLSNTNPAITTKVFLQASPPFGIDPDVVEFSSVITNAQGITTNLIYLQDSFLTYTNLQLVLDGYAGVGTSRPTYRPENYTFFQGGQFFVGTPAPPTAIPPGTFTVGGNGTVTNQYAAYQAIFQPNSVVLGDVAGQNVTNLPGRIELTADHFLTLTRAQISSVNYILLKATNQFGGSSGAQISAPFADLYLHSTNGLLNITNVLVPDLPLPIGICDLFSARWTNIVAGITNRFHVLFVDAQFAPISPLMVQTLSLSTSTTKVPPPDDSIFISDVFNVTSNLLIDTLRLTLATNAPGSPNPAGVLDYLNPSILWPASTPRLRYLTNYGVIESQNLAVFGGSQTSPYSSPASSTNPYSAFVNAGGVTNYSSFIFASYFQNSGTFSASGGAIQLLQAQTAVLTNGAFLAPGSAGTIKIQGGSLLISNHVLQAGNALTLSLTNYLNDGSLGVGADGVANGNVWYAGYGINLPMLPTNSSLLATTITNTGPAGVIPNTWAGRDLGPTPAGYNNNAAVGRLILDGLTNTTKFHFQGPAANNALYVDYLEMRDYMTVFDGSGNLANLQFAPGMKIYYAQLIINGVSWAEKLNHKNGGGLNWVSDYAGTYSYTNVVYPDGTTNRLNLALVQSCDLDSNGNGIPNCQDPAPVFVSSEVVLAAALTNLPQRSVVLTWNSIPFATNSVFFKPSLTAANWQLLTNPLLTNPFVLGSVGGRQRVVDPVGAGGRFYRVQVNAAVP